MQQTRDQRFIGANIPREPGVYLFGDDTGGILYVGKAKNLHRRVRSYFCPARGVHLKIRRLMERARNLELLVVRSEWDALLLEARLIRSLRPRFNTRLKDSRGYPFLQIAVDQSTPRVGLTDRVRRDGSAYFGPVPEAAAVHGALEVIRRLYTLRPESFERNGLDADARRMAADMLDLANGNGRVIRERIETSMFAAASALDFERALRLRDALVTTSRIANYPRVRPGRDPLGRGVAVVERFAVDLPLRRNTRR